MSDSGMRMRLMLLATASVLANSPKERAICVVLQAAEYAAARKPPGWEWTVWLATAITIARIEGALAPAPRDS